MLGSTTRIAWRSLGRNRRRTALALAAIAIAQIAVLAVDGLMNGLVESTTNALTGPMLGHVQVHAPEWREEQAPDLVIDRLDDRLARIRAIPGVERAYPRLFAPALIARDIDGHAAMVVGVDPALESQPGGMIEGVTALPHERVVLVGAALAREMEIVIGDELAVVGTGADGSMANDLVTVGGILHTPIELVDRTGVVMALGSAQETFAMPDMAHEITILGSGSVNDAPALAARVKRALPRLEVLPWRELAPEIATMLDIGGYYGIIVLLIVFSAAAAGVANTMLMATFERRRELGMLLSLGTTPGRLIRMITTEAVLLGLAGVIAGSAIGAALVLWQGHTGIQLLAGSGSGASFEGMSFDSTLYPYLRAIDFVPGFAGIVVVSILAALWPAVHTARLEPMEAMRS
jgi:ABC-type lipoprotein release transport system permease subunit